MERGCVEDQPQQLRPTMGLEISQHPEHAAAGRGRHSRAPFIAPFYFGIRVQFNFHRFEATAPDACIISFKTVPFLGASLTQPFLLLVFRI